MKTFVEKIADVLKKTDLSFPEQVAVVASIEMVVSGLDSGLAADIEEQYGRMAVDVLINASQQQKADHEVDHHYHRIGRD